MSCEKGEETVKEGRKNSYNYPPHPLLISESSTVLLKSDVCFRERPELIWQNGVDVVLGVVPFSHPFGLVGVLCSCLVRGCTLVTSPHWELRRILKTCHQYKVRPVSQSLPNQVVMLHSNSQSFFVVTHFGAR